MSIEKTTTLVGQNKSILLVAGMLFQNINIKVKKSDVESYLVDGKLPAATPLSKDGKVVDGTTVQASETLGLLYRDVDFSYSNGNESVPITIFGFVKDSGLPATVTDDVKEALKMIQFL